MSIKISGGLKPTNYVYSYNEGPLPKGFESIGLECSSSPETASNSRNCNRVLLVTLLRGSDPEVYKINEAVVKALFSDHVNLKMSGNASRSRILNILLMNGLISPSLLQKNLPPANPSSLKDLSLLRIAKHIHKVSEVEEGSEIARIRESFEGAEGTLQAAGKSLGVAVEELAISGGGLVVSEEGFAGKSLFALEGSLGLVRERSIATTGTFRIAERSQLLERVKQQLSPFPCDLLEKLVLEIKKETFELHSYLWVYS